MLIKVIVSLLAIFVTGTAFALECKLVSSGAESPSAVIAKRKYGSCIPRGIDTCVMDIVCTGDDGKDFQTSAICLATLEGKCPSVSECVKAEGLEMKAAEIEQDKPVGASAAKEKSSARDGSRKAAE